MTLLSDGVRVNPLVEETIAKSNLLWLRAGTIFLTRHGSHSYGTNIETSDEDFKGVAIPPSEYFHGFVRRFDQAEFRDPNPDMVIYDLRKFMALAADCNPNIIEMLWTDPSDHLLLTSLGERLLAARSVFISKKAKHTFSGYALSQLKRINTHYRWLKNPPKAMPMRVDFGLPERTVIPADQLEAAHAAIKKQLDRWSFKDLEEIDEATRIGIINSMAEALSEMKIGADEQFRAAGRLLGYADNFLELLDRERHYNAQKTEWQQYQNWKKTRNPARAELEEKWGYDCYLDDTEFLTDDGWKRYDEVGATNQLATLNQSSGEIEYQKFTDRVAKPYTGKIAILYPRHSNCAVTPNHRMWVSPAHRSTANGFSKTFVAEGAEWSIQKMEDLLTGRRSTFHVRVTGTPKVKDFEISDDMLLLVGCYVSEGCVGKRLADGTASVIRLSQKVGGRQEKFATILHVKHSSFVRRFTYTHDEETRREPCEEYVWTIANREWAQNVEKWCGSGSESKHLPSWTTQLSARQVDLLLEVMIAGDGTERPFSRVYYTASKRLADDLQAMCVAGGVVSQVWGPYANRDDAPMYQIYIGRRLEAVAARFCEEGSEQLTIEEVSNVRVVCFTVPNEILVTRRKGNVAIQGNTKHAGHLVRLLRMCREILTTGTVVVKRPDRDELLAIRNGAWKYEDLVSWATKQDEELTLVMKESSLPHAPDRNKLDSLCQGLVEEALSTKGAVS